LVGNCHANTVFLQEYQRGFA
jgi:signal transduction histidine kinase